MVNCDSDGPDDPDEPEAVVGVAARVVGVAAAAVAVGVGLAVAAWLAVPPPEEQAASATVHSMTMDAPNVRHVGIRQSRVAMCPLPLTIGHA